jgi:hypothetical protein
MAVFMAAALDGITLAQRPQVWVEALRDQLLAIPITSNIDPTPCRQHIRLVFDVAFSNSSAVLASPVLSPSEKLQRLQILYIIPAYRTTQTHLEELSKVQLMPDTDLNFKLQAIGLVISHMGVYIWDFKEILAWIKGEFKKDKYSIFTNTDSLGDIGDEAIFALVEKRQHYLSLYENFQPYATHYFIEAEIAEISQQVATKEIPKDLADTLIFQLKKFLPNAIDGFRSESDRHYDNYSKSESK